MANLPSYKSRRSPTQNAIVTFIVMAVAFVSFGVLPTQWFASQYQYDPNLGPALFRGGGIALYAPTDWVRWGLRLGDIEQLRGAVHVMMGLGVFSVFLSLIFGIFVAHWLAKYSPGMEGLHGTAHFAERDDVDKTGFINARGYKATGVVIGSVLLDSKHGNGAIIHPNHRQFKKRYRPIFVRGTLRQFYRKYPKRDSNGRPMYAVQKRVVKKIELLRDGGNTHLFAFCPTRSGKGVGMVIPTLLTWPNSVMVNDPKGEAYALTAGFRSAAGQDTIKFEPVCLDGTGARWNPLDEIRIFTPHDVADAQMIMAMACDPEGKGLNDYFDRAGYAFLTGVALHVRYIGNDGSLAGVANFLGDPLWDSPRQMYTEMMQACHDPEGKMNWTDSLGNPTKTHPMIAVAAKTMMNKEEKDQSGVTSTATSLLTLYLDPIVAKNTSCSDFLVRDLMTGAKPVSLYYVVGSADMVRMVPLTRLFYALFIRRNAADMVFKDGRSVANYTFPLLMIIDEMASLQKLPILQEALGYVAGYGIRLFMLVQDIAQVEELYGDKQSFDSGAETRIVYAPNKIETAEKLARMSGKTTITEENVSNSRDLIGIKAGSVSLSTSKTGRDLITDSEFMGLHDQDVVVFVKGQPPIYGRKAFYYEDPVMQARASMPPPARSAKLRTVAKVEDVVVIEKNEVKVETAADKWAAQRIAMADKIAVVQSPEAVEYSGRNRRVAVDASDGEGRKPRSRYADKAVVISAEELKRVQEFVADVALIDKVVAVSAF